MIKAPSKVPCYVLQTKDLEESRELSRTWRVSFTKETKELGVEKHNATIYLGITVNKYPCRRLHREAFLHFKTCLSLIINI